MTEKIIHVPDPTATDQSRFKGWVQVETIDGRELDCVVTDNWGSKHNPMTPEQIRDKFRDNAGLVLSETKVAAITEQVALIDALTDVGGLVETCVAE